MSAGEDSDKKPANLAWTHEAIVSSAQLGTIVYRLEDPDDPRSLRLLYANAAASEATRIDLQSLVGKQILDAFPNLEGTPLPDTFRQVALSGETAEVGDVEYGDESIPLSIFETHACCLGAGHVVVSFNNVTALREMQAQLTRRSEELEEALRNKEAQVQATERMAVLGSLLAGIAHEMRTPLAAISSNNQVLARCMEKIADGVEAIDDLPAPLPKVLPIVQSLPDVNATAIERLEGLVSTLRRFGRPDAAEPEAVDLRSLLESTLGLVRHELKYRIEVEEVYADVPAVPGHPSQLGQVFTNLLVNAAQAIDDKGRISVRTRMLGGWIAVEIADTGVGIPPENLEDIFQTGFTTKEATVGTGLGLPISAEIVRSHGGRIEVESTPNVGSTFRVLLPAPD